MKLTANQLKRIHILAKDAKMPRDERVKIMKFFYGVSTSKELTENNAGRFIRKLEEIISGETTVAWRSNGDPDWVYTGKL